MRATLFCLGNDPRPLPARDLVFPGRPVLDASLRAFAAQQLGLEPEENPLLVHYDRDVLILSEDEDGATEINRLASDAAKDVADTLDGRGHWDANPIWGNCLILERGA